MAAFQSLHICIMPLLGKCANFRFFDLPFCLHQAFHFLDKFFTFFSFSIGFFSSFFRGKDSSLLICGSITRAKKVQTAPVSPVLFSNFFRTVHIVGNIHGACHVVILLVFSSIKVARRLQALERQQAFSPMHSCRS